MKTKDAGLIIGVFAVIIFMMGVIWIISEYHDADIVIMNGQEYLYRGATKTYHYFNPDPIDFSKLQEGGDSSCAKKKHED